MWGNSKSIACKWLNNFTLNYLKAGKKKAPAVPASTNHTCPQGTQDLVHFNNPFYDSFSQVNIPNQLCLLLGAIYRTTLASAEWNTDANLLAVLECLSDLLVRSSVKGSLRTFSASTYVTSSSMSVDCAPQKNFSVRKAAMDLDAVPMLPGAPAGLLYHYTSRTKAYIPGVHTVRC